MPVVTFSPGDNLTAAKMTQFAADSGWLSVAATQNSWTGTVYYRKVGTLVTLNGRLTGGTVNTVAVTLPSGYRPGTPAGTCYFVGTDTVNNAATFSIAAAGNINVRSVNATEVNCAQFYTD